MSDETAAFIAELLETIEKHDCALVLESCGAIGPEATRRMLRYRKQHGELPPYRYVEIR